MALGMIFHRRSRSASTTLSTTNPVTREAIQTELNVAPTASASRGPAKKTTTDSSNRWRPTWGEEERFNREKHTKAFPDQAVEFCLRTAGITIREVDAVAFAHRAGADMMRGGLDALSRLPLGAKRLAAQAYVDASLVRK